MLSFVNKPKLRLFHQLVCADRLRPSGCITVIFHCEFDLFYGLRPFFCTRKDISLDRALARSEIDFGDARNTLPPVGKWAHAALLYFHC